MGGLSERPETVLPQGAATLQGASRQGAGGESRMCSYEGSLRKMIINPMGALEAPAAGGVEDEGAMTEWNELRGQRKTIHGQPYRNYWQEPRMEVCQRELAGSLWVCLDLQIRTRWDPRRRREGHISLQPCPLRAKPFHRAPALGTVPTVPALRQRRSTRTSHRQAVQDLRCRRAALARGHRLGHLGSRSTGGAQSQCDGGGWQGRCSGRRGKRGRLDLRLEEHGRPAGGRVAHAGAIGPSDLFGPFTGGQNCGPIVEALSYETHWRWLPGVCADGLVQMLMYFTGVCAVISRN